MLSRFRVAVLCLAIVGVGLPSAGSGAVTSDVFGMGKNEFTLDFVRISGDASSANGSEMGVSAGHIRTFTDPGYDYRIGRYEVTNDQWDKFVAEAAPAGYWGTSYWTGSGIPVNQRSWVRAAHFVNWLNTNSGHQAAYQFVPFEGFGGGLVFKPWDATDAWGGANLYRHKDAYYFLPTEDEWVKAAYWNGTELQQYATKAGETLHQGDSTSGTGWNYVDLWHATDPPGPWNVGSGSQELNGTYDMMGNVWEWMESPWYDPFYGADAWRAIRGSSYGGGEYGMSLSCRSDGGLNDAHNELGFRVASAVNVIPEPSSMMAWIGMAMVGFLWFWRRR